MGVSGALQARRPCPSLSWQAMLHGLDGLDGLDGVELGALAGIERELQVTLGLQLGA